MSVEALDIASRDQPRIPTFAALLLFAVVLGFVGSLAVQLPNIRLHQLSASGAVIGISTSIQAAGIVVGALASVAMLRFASTALVMGCGCLLAGGALFALDAAAGVESMTFWRFVMAGGSGAVLTTAEYVLVARARPGERATRIAAFATCGIAGNALAPALIGVLGPHSDRPLYAAGAAMMMLAPLPFLAGVRGRAETPAGSWRNSWLLMRFPMLFAPALAFGVIDGGFMELLNVYLLTRDLSVSAASAVALAACIGAFCLQVPVGLASDRLGHARMHKCVWIVIAASVCGLYFGEGRWSLIIAAFLLGGACDALYAIGFARLAGNVDADRLAPANGCFVAMCGVGEIIGPIVAGGALHAGAGGGFTIALLLIALLGLVSARRN